MALVEVNEADEAAKWPRTDFAAGTLCRVVSFSAALGCLLLSAFVVDFERVEEQYGV